MQAGELFRSLQDRIGSPIKDVVPAHATVATVDSIRHFARAYGDDNSIYSDPECAAASVRGELVAPPLFPIAAGVPSTELGTPSDDLVDLDRLPGVRTQTILRDRWLLCRPITAGTRLQRDRRLASVVLEEAGCCDLTERTTYFADETVYAVHHRSRRYLLSGAAPSTSIRTGKARYSPEQITGIEQAYEAETVRGAVPLHLDDVAAGDRIGPIVKGPLTITDLVEYRSGVGPGPLGGEPLRLAYLNRKRRPELYAPDATGIPDITERRHWDENYAQSLGVPSANDYSHTRLTWFSHLLTNWMGDGGWLRELDGSTTLGPNYVGDTHWIEGEVVGITAHESFGEIHLSLSGHNQLDEVTCEAGAVVALPRRPSNVVSNDQLASLGDDDREGGRAP